MSDHNVNSTFRKTLVELCETATWITSQVYAAKNLEKNDLITVDNKISALYPIAEKYDRSFRTTTSFANVRFSQPSFSPSMRLCFGQTPTSYGTSNVISVLSKALVSIVLTI
ncbi:AGK_G0026600.mRNA.1.CDS.1 [Saccharomyces cerevisiae]|nr:AGK_G0026600.mRNA.1.CDS.1 [Saccharomyces cerevisiae]CAI6604032.1 AGK_G0026600.mRNA.1.CDS.1 [Saccharomyces cerevisiae]